MRWGVPKVFSPEPLNVYYMVVKWAMVRLILILNCILGFRCHFCIGFTNSFACASIPKEVQVFIEFPRDFNINVFPCCCFILIDYKPVWSSQIHTDLG